jgi:alginate O-acetyltransferase complex protein AlgI
MDFYSLGFCVFSLIILVLFFLTPTRFRWLVLLTASYAFYATFKVAYLALMIFSTLTAYFAALGMRRWNTPSTKKLLLIFSLTCNLGILFVFKYFDFLDVSIQQILGLGHITYTSHALKLLVPVGISFYVFQVVSYVIDVYRRDVVAEKHLGIFSLYIAFFPKLLAGPIERAKHFIPQLRENRSFDIEQFTNGLKLVCWGLFKKLVLADRLAAFVNVVYADPQAYSGVSLVLSVIFYSFQIYCDFSGYTDMAIGLAQMFGLSLSDNFNRPCSATSVSDFWRRWHISLSFWFRDYLYISLGGSRVRISRHYLNYLLVFLICGLWHGASWTFVAWGLIHGSYLIFGRASVDMRAKWITAVGLNKKPRLHRGFQILFTFTLISLAWIFFRANTLSDAYYIISHLHEGWENIFNRESLSSMIFLTKSETDLVIVVVSLTFLGIVHRMQRHENMRRLFTDKPVWLRFALYYVIVAGILLLSLPDTANFIYFQF